MKLVNLLVFASLWCLVSSVSQVYYITPTQPDPQHSCHVNGTTLHPCYTLQQLNGVLSSSNGSVEVLLLPGTHLIKRKQTLNVSHFSEVVIRPWKEELEMVIECKEFTYLTNIWFQNIIELNILSLHFSSCMLQYGYEMNSKTERSVNITKSMFEKSVVDIRSSESKLNVTVSNCTFSLSNRGTLFVLPPGYGNRQPHFDKRHITIANLQIVDTLFQDNSMNIIGSIFHVVYANLIISNCLFMNNSISGNSEGIFVVYSSLILKDTTFLHFSSKENREISGHGLHLKDSSGTIDACLFNCKKFSFDKWCSLYRGFSIAHE